MLIKKLEKTLHWLHNLISFYANQNKIIDQQFNENKKNLIDLHKLLNDYDNLLNKMNSCNYDDMNEIYTIIGELHIDIETLKWHLEEIDELLINVSKILPSQKKFIEQA